MGNTIRVGIIGGGISGVVTALHLANAGIDTIIFEQKPSLIDGPPFGHLHSGGNLYPDISDAQCKELMRQTIEIARLFPDSIDRRPTALCIPQSHPMEPQELERRLQMLAQHYSQLIQEDPKNQILGEVDDYYKRYSRGDIQELYHSPIQENPLTMDHWMRNALEVMDSSKIKTPVFLVQEYGWNMFRLAAAAELALSKAETCQVLCNTKVKGILDIRSLPTPGNWEIETSIQIHQVDYLVNASGFQSGELEEELGIQREGWIEFKSSFLSQWDSAPYPLPEMVFHGERGTPQGMAQLTPYPGGYFQIHAMSEGVSLFSGGLVKLPETGEAPVFSQEIVHKLTRGWDPSEAEKRTNKAIARIANFVPGFHTAKVGGPPMYGAQQILGREPNLRVAEVNFPLKAYARIETIKASSTLVAARKVLADIRKQTEANDLSPSPDPSSQKGVQNDLLEILSPQRIETLAQEIARSRGLPECLAQLMVKPH